MAEINPETLKKWRTRRNLTLDELAEKAQVDKQTIHRLERGRGRQARGTTLERLAKALKLAPEVLAQPDEGAWEPNKSQIKLTISNQARNALLLVCERYHVRSAQIIELAPLLFNWAAEKCLRQHQERVEILRQRECGISEEIEHFYSDLGKLVGGPPPPEIELHDLSEFWANESARDDYLFSADDFFGCEPIVDFLDGLVSEMGDETEFVRWDENSSPSYSICKEEVAWLANGDEVATENILQGYAPLHEMPKEFWEQFRKRNTFPFTDDATRQRQAAERVAWLRAHGKPDESPEVAP